MNVRPVILIAWLSVWIGALFRLSAAPPVIPADLPVMARSVSGQFLVHGRSSTLPGPTAQIRRVGTNEVISLRPDLLVVSAERIKQGIERLLGLHDAWRGSIHIQIRDAARLSGPLSIQARVFREGWQYTVVVPDEIEWERLIRGLTEVVLLERANRSNPGEECAFVPLWLTTGMHELLMASAGRDLVAESGTLINRSERWKDTLRRSRAGLDGREPMPFSDLSLATINEMSDPARFADFQSSAALFTFELIREDSGRSALVDFIRRLPESLNWQTVFLRAYGDRFPRLLDVEKWWAVSSAETLAADSRQHWPRDRVLQRLSELLFETADVRSDTNQPSVRQTLPLRDLIVSWDFDVQRDVVRRKAAQIRALGMRAPVEVAPLVGDSARVLEDYLAVRGGSVPSNPGKSSLELRGRTVAESTARKLVVLEERIDQARRTTPPPPSAPADPAGAVAAPGRISAKVSPSSGG